MAILAGMSRPISAPCIKYATRRADPPDGDRSIEPSCHKRLSKAMDEKQKAGR